MNFNKLSGSTIKIITIVLAVVVLGVFGSTAQDKSSDKAQDAQSSTETFIKQVDSKYVCMVTNKLFQKEQIPVTIEGKTYYGCCEMCKGRLKNDPGSRTAVDPVSGKVVDKALSVTGVTTKGDIYYFEDKNNLQNFNKSDHK